VTTRDRTDATRIFFKLSRSLKKICDNVSYIGVGDESLVRDGIKIIGVPPCKKSISLCQIKRILSTYKKALEEKADLYQLHTPELIPLGLYLKSKRKKVIYDQHEFVHVTVRGWLFLRAVRLFLKHFFLWLEGLAYKYFDLIICDTEGIYEIARGNKCVVANFVDVKLIEKIEYKKNELFSIVYAGGLSVDRSIYDLVEAIGELNKEGIHVSLDLMGRWEKGLEEKCIELEGWGYTRYHGQLDPIDVYKVMKTCHVGVSVLKPFENYMEGWAVKIFEYMACGLPVIGSNFPRWKSFYKDSILYCEPSMEGIKESIKALYQDNQLREELIRKGKDFVLEKCNWGSQEKILFEKIFKLYEDED